MTTTVNLHGTWKLRCEARGIEIDYQVPGDVHSALIKAGVIPDPYVGKNELACRWVADEEWVAKREFDLDELGGGEWHLDIDYLDTVADVLINGEKVLSAESCFRRYQPEVTKTLLKGANTVEVVLHSNTKAANEKQAAQPFYIPYHAGNCPIPNGNMLRKPQCHFGWDWNLAIVPFGVCGTFSVENEATEKFHVIVTQHHLANGCVEVKISVGAPRVGLQTTSITVTCDGVEKEILATKRDANEGFLHEEVTFLIANPKLWWPVGHGGQDLIEVSISCGTEVFRQRLGLCKVELIDEVDPVGRRFAFRVNGRELFCRGANWIPADALPSNITPERCRKLLLAAVNANMNMIRVWGGGYYEQDWFYDICDELGILIWQDFQFSCNLYPSTPQFLKSVRREVSEQVSRLRYHPCMALWCGDNELIGALTWFEESRQNRDRYLVCYDRLNNAIEASAKAVSSKINWWPSSPSPGALDFGDAWHDDSKGDMHFWSVWHEGRDFEHYRNVKPRFCSEFGFQSFPSMRIIKQFIESEDDLNISSDVMQHHQRNAGGNARIAETMFRYFRFPEGFANFVYVSQVQHGLAMQTAVDYWRSLKPHCMGTLMWQLNDTWPVASWSGLDHDGGWKAMHHMARDFYAPISVVAIPDKQKSHIKLMAINDDLSAETKILIQLEVIDMQGKRKSLPSIKAKIPTDRAVEVGEISRAQIPDDAMLFWTFNNIRRHFAFQPYKYLKLPKPSITSKVKEAKGALAIEVSAKALALHVMLECDVSGHFSKNVFDLLPGETQSLTFTPDNPKDLTRARDTLVIRDLYSSSHQTKT